MTAPLRPRSGENVLLSKKKRDRSVTCSALGWQVPEETHLPHTRCLTQVHNPQSRLSSCGSPTLDAPFILPPSPGGTPGHPSGYLPVPVLGPRFWRALRRRSSPHPPPPRRPRLRSIPSGTSPRRSPFPAAGPLLRGALRLRSSPARRPPSPRLRSTPFVSPRAGLPSPLRVLFEAPSSLPQARGPRLESPSPGPSAL